MSGFISSRVLAAPFSLPGCRDNLGESIWLYLYLVVGANHHGLVLRHVERVATDLEVDQDTVEVWLSRLRDSQLIDLESARPYLVIKLRSWSNGTPSLPEKTAEIPPKAIDSPLGVPVSSSNAAAAAASSNRENRGLGEGEGLLDQVVAALGADVNRNEIGQLLTQFAPETVNRALRRVAETPASQIRKSKAALFRYLLTKLS